MHLIDTLAQWREFEARLPPPSTSCAGGSSANTVALMARHGARTRYCGVIGTDRHGKIYQDKMNEDGVLFASGRARTRSNPDDGEDNSKDNANISAKTLNSASATGRCLVLVTPDGERTMVTWLGIAGQARATRHSLSSHC